jgi:hypothetical protein
MKTLKRPDFTRKTGAQGEDKYNFSFVLSPEGDPVIRAHANPIRKWLLTWVKTDFL